MTEEQKKYYNAMKKLGSKKPQKPIPRPLVSALYRPRAEGGPIWKQTPVGLLRARKGVSDGLPVPSHRLLLTASRRSEENGTRTGMKVWGGFYT